MGFFGDLIGSPDSAIMNSPLIGRGEVLGVQMSGMTLQVGNGLTERKCTITLKVYLDGQQPYEAQAVQRIQEIYLPQLSSGSAIVAVRVEEADHSKVAIDFNTPVPTITMPRSEGHNSAAWVLANGKPITVVLVANEPIGVKNADGIDVQALTLTVATGVPTFLGFPTGVTNGYYDHTFDLTLASSFNPAYVTANGGTPPYQWSVASGTVPPGLVLSNAGILSGTPTSTRLISW